MIAPRVLSEEELQAELKKRGFEPTDETTATGRFWKNKANNKHVLVPTSIDGFYPTWLLADLDEHVGRIRATWN